MQRSERNQVWSSGGGVQSTAIAALICQGRLPKPDLAVIADTSREYSPVWRYLQSIVMPALRGAGVTMHIAPHSLATVDLYSGADGGTLVIPAFTDQAGQRSKLPKYCSQEWKTRVIQRFCRRHGINDGEVWIGYTIDEAERMRVYDPNDKWPHIYPLAQLGLRRSDCATVIADMGWPPAPRSACWMCPFRSDQEWTLMRDESPDDWERAIAFDHEIRQRDPHVYLHRSCVPLAEVDFDTQPDLFAKPCNAGGCFT